MLHHARNVTYALPPGEASATAHPARTGLDREDERYFVERFADLPYWPRRRAVLGGPQNASRQRDLRLFGRRTTSGRRHVRKRRRVDVSIDEYGGRTTAFARLPWGEQVSVGTGIAKCHPADRDIADIGDELAVARALSDLAVRMFTVARKHIESVTGETVSRL